MAWADPALFGGLIDLLTEQTIAYLSAQIEAGAEAVMLFDSWAGVLAPALFRAHVVGPAARIVGALKARHPAVPVIGFPRLAGSMLGGVRRARPACRRRRRYLGRPRDGGAGMCRRGWRCRAISIRWRWWPAARAMARRDRLRILAAMRGRPFIFNLGHGIVPETASGPCRCPGGTSSCGLTSELTAGAPMTSRASPSSCSTWAGRTARKRSGRSCSTCSPIRRCCGCNASCGRSWPASSPRRG